jgi:hypothetical protein
VAREKVIGTKSTNEEDPRATVFKAPMKPISSVLSTGGSGGPGFSAMSSSIGFGPVAPRLGGSGVRNSKCVEWTFSVLNEIGSCSE